MRSTKTMMLKREGGENYSTAYKFAWHDYAQILFVSGISSRMHTIGSRRCRRHTRSHIRAKLLKMNHDVGGRSVTRKSPRFIAYRGLLKLISRFPHLGRDIRGGSQNPSKIYGAKVRDVCEKGGQRDPLTSEGGLESLASAPLKSGIKIAQPRSSARHQ